MPPERSHAEASRLRARQSRIATSSPPPDHLLRPCKWLFPRFSGGSLTLRQRGLESVLRQVCPDARRRRPHRAAPRRRRGAAPVLVPIVVHDSRESSPLVAADGAPDRLPAHRFPARRRGLGAVLALLPLPGPGSRRAALRAPRGRLGARAVPGRPPPAVRRGGLRAAFGGGALRGVRASPSAAAVRSSSPRTARTPPTCARACGIGCGRTRTTRPTGAGWSCARGSWRCRRPRRRSCGARRLGALAGGVVDAARADLAGRSRLPAGPLGRPGGVRRLRACRARRTAMRSASATGRRRR